jgi:CRP-like cAMP-binding protein
MKQNLIDFIKKHIDFSEEDIQLAQPLFKDLTLKKGEFWVKKGEFNADVMFVNKGMLRSYFMKKDVEVTFGLTTENQILTSTACYSAGVLSLDYIQAIEECDICMIAKVDLDYLFLHSKKWERLGRIFFEAYTVQQEMRVRSFVSETASERYENLVKSKPELIRRTPQIYLASYLGITPQSLSRLRREIIK